MKTIKVTRDHTVGYANPEIVTHYIIVDNVLSIQDKKTYSVIHLVNGKSIEVDELAPDIVKEINREYINNGN